jgi:ribosomal protein S18 acetylase RimI-like enzyme
LRVQAIELEAINMASYPRNGPALESLLNDAAGKLAMKLATVQGEGGHEELVGFLLHERDADEHGFCFVYEVQVKVDARRCKIGSKLLAMAAAGGKEMELEVHEDNYDAFAFYLKVGFDLFNKHWVEEIRDGKLFRDGYRILRTGLPPRVPSQSIKNARE